MEGQLLIFLLIFVTAFPYGQSTTHHEKWGKCFEGEIYPVEQQKHWMGNSCYDVEGNEYQSNQTILSCCGCIKLTCLTGQVPSESFLESFWNVSVEDTCCKDCNGTVFPIGAVMGSHSLGDRCNTTVTKQCVSQSQGSEIAAVISDRFESASCCIDSTGSHPLGKVILDPETCSSRQCSLSKGNLYSSWISSVKKCPGSGCGCCVHHGELVCDGGHVTLCHRVRVTATCCEGELLVAPPPGIEDKKASPTCSPDGVLKSTALPQVHPLWSPSAHFNLTIVGMAEAEKTSLKRAFDQALVLAVAFNHDLGYKTFYKAYTSSNSSNSSCCLCLWTLAYLNAPNLNTPNINADSRESRLENATIAAKEAYNSCLKPNQTTENALERALVSAMVARFPANRNDSKGNTTVDEDFARKMGEIANNASLHMDNDLVRADLHIFHAEAQMNLIAWDYYENGTLKDNATKAKTSLDIALSIDPCHPFANHLAIHLFEPSNNTNFLEKAERAGDILKNMTPQELGAGIGHLLHMPSHAYSRTGRYHEAVRVNKVGIEDDSNYFSNCNVSPDDFYRLNYYTHKHAFLIWAATMSGESEVALNFTKKLFDVEDVNITNVATHLAMNGSVIFSYPNWKYQILITFGRFGEMEKERLPDHTGNKLLDTYREAMFYFARSYAGASLRHCNQSIQDKNRFLDLANITNIPFKKLGRINVRELLYLSEKILLGRLCGRKCGNCSKSEVEYLYEAVAKQNEFPYDEPKYWPDHVRSCLGAALLRENKWEDALAVFKEDLDTAHYPNNGWSLKGKELALRALRRDDEAEKVKTNFSVPCF